MFSFRLRLTALVTCSLFTLVATACSHVVTIDSEPPGATIYVNGEKMGTAPVTYTEKTGWDKVYEVSAKKRGYAKTRREVKQTEWNTTVLMGSIFAGTCCVFPWGYLGLIVGRQMPDTVTIELDRNGGAVSKPPKATQEAAPGDALGTVDESEGSPDDDEEDYGY